MLKADAQGVDLVLKLFGKLTANARAAVPETMDKMASIILTRALKYVPVATGALRASGRKEVWGTGLKTQMRVFFGGPGVHYAVYVHENPLMYHEPPTSSKYLARASRETRGTRTAMVKRLLGEITFGG